VDARNLIEFLEMYGEGVIDRLRTTYKSDEAMLRRDIDLGDEPKSVLIEKSLSAVPVRKALVEASMEPMRVKIDELMDGVARRIRLIKRLQTGAATVGAVSSGGLAIAIAKAGQLAEGQTSLILAAIGFLSSVMVIFSDRLAGGGGSEAKSAFVEAVAISRDLLKVERRAKRADEGVDAILFWDELLNELDDLTIRMHELGALLRVS
jgi:hypothetical protein